MKIKRSEAAALFKSMGFPNAAKWDDGKLTDRLREVPTKLSEEEVDKAHVQLYNGLVQLGKDELIEIIGGSGKGDAGDGKPLGRTEEKEAKPSKKGKKSKKDAPAKKEKKEKKQRPEVERDGFGAAKGSVRAMLNEALTDEYQSEEDIVKATGLTKKQVRTLLRRAARKGFAEKEKLIRYRLTDKGAKTKAGKTKPEKE